MDALVRQFAFAVTALLALSSCGIVNASEEASLHPGPPAPLRDGEAFLFRFHAPEADTVYLAGSFNDWANNNDGMISSDAFAMTPVGDGLWTREEELEMGTIRYKYVVKDAAGEYNWVPDPNVEGRDGDSNTVLDLRTLFPGRFVTTVAGRPLEARVPTLPDLEGGAKFTNVRLERTWVRLGEVHVVDVTLEAPRGAAEGARLLVRTTRNLTDWQERTEIVSTSPTQLQFPAGTLEQPIVLELLAFMGDSARPSDRWFGVLPVAQEPSDDLRYGFYANWNRVSDDYAAKSAMLADLLLNAVEYYDYFPAHGKYAPTEEEYEFEPFYGNKIYAADIAGKIASDRERGILAIAYVAAYAASRSVFDAHPYPMTDADGEPLVFNGRVLPEDEADRLGEEKWFWLMAIAADSPWRRIVMEEFRRTLTDKPGDLVAFDGFEIDSYGHANDTRYYSEGSKWSGELLSDVIADFIEEAWRMTHSVKEPAAVSFNCVNEFGIEGMYHITDFLFVENWAFYKPGIEETVDICYRHRAPTGQRVVLKMYPADAGFENPAYFPPQNLKLMLGMCITGGGSLMIAGEPNERTGEMHALNSLYYPDNVAIPEGHVDIIRRYNTFDAMLYGFNHGRSVRNVESGLYLPGCVVRGFENARGDRTVMLLHHGAANSWNAPLMEGRKPMRDVEIALRVPNSDRVSAVFYASPDSPELMTPIPLDFEARDGFIRTIIPEIDMLGAVILRVE